MARLMQLLGWESEGLRCPDHKIDFTVSTDFSRTIYNISLIQMPNGTGKTTTLSLLRAALSGAAQNWTTSQIREYRKRGGSSDYGKFSVRLELNNQLVTIILSFNFANNTVFYKTTRGEGQVEFFDPPLDFRKFMDTNFVNFYVFDGELAEHLLSREHTDAESVIQYLFQINVLEGISRKVEAYWDAQTRRIGATGERAFSRRRNRVELLRRRLLELEKQQSKLIQEQVEIQRNLELQQSKYDQQIKREKEREEAVTLASTQLTAAEMKVRNQSLATLEAMADPYALSMQFATAIYDLKLGLDRVKLPESAAREFFMELAEEEECICGRPIDASIRDIIRTRASQYLGSEDVSLLNAMKSDITEAVGRSLEQPARDLQAQFLVLENNVIAERRARTELETIKQEAETDPAVKQAREEVDTLQRQLNEVSRNLVAFSDNDERGDEQTTDIKIIQEKLEKAEEELAEITETLQLKKKRDVLVNILKTAHDTAAANIKREICKAANARIEELMPDNNIRIDRIEDCLILEDQAGGSAGEELSVAYAFLSTLFIRSDHQLPFVVDSPAGPIDLGIRPKIAALVPKLSNQFVAFTISSERDGFVPRLQPSNETPIQYITLFRKGNTEADERARRSKSFVETEDGLIVVDKDFFNEFQDEVER